MHETALTTTASTSTPAGERAARLSTPNPIYQALRSKVLHFDFGDQPVPVAFARGPRWKRPQVKAVIATSLTPEVQAWCTQLARDIAADSNCEAENRRYAHLAKPNCLRGSYLETLGQWVGSDEDDGEEFPESVIYRGELIAVLLDPAGTRPIGLTGAQLAWSADRNSSEDESAELYVNVDTAWIAPDYRGKDYSSLLAWALAEAALRTIRLVQEKAAWPDDTPAKLSVVFGGDVISSSGGQFLESCADFFCHRVDVKKELRSSRFKLTDVTTDARD